MVSTLTFKHKHETSVVFVAAEDLYKYNTLHYATHYPTP